MPRRKKKRQCSLSTYIQDTNVMPSAMRTTCDVMDRKAKNGNNDVEKQRLRLSKSIRNSCSSLAMDMKVSFPSGHIDSTGVRRQSPDSGLSDSELSSPIREHKRLHRIQHPSHHYGHRESDFHQTLSPCVSFAHRKLETSQSNPPGYHGIRLPPAVARASTQHLQVPKPPAKSILKKTYSDPTQCTARRLDELRFPCVNKAQSMSLPSWAMTSGHTDPTLRHKCSQEFAAVLRNIDDNTPSMHSSTGDEDT